MHPEINQGKGQENGASKDLENSSALVLAALEQLSSTEETGEILAALQTLYKTVRDRKSSEPLYVPTDFGRWYCCVSNNRDALHLYLVDRDDLADYEMRKQALEHFTVIFHTGTGSVLDIMEINPASALDDSDQPIRSLYTAGAESSATFAQQHAPRIRNYVDAFRREMPEATSTVPAVEATPIAA